MPAQPDANPAHQQYANPKLLVSTDWVAEHLDDPTVVVVESDEDVLLYDTGHIPGAIKIDWHMDLNDPVTRDYLTAEAFAALMSEKGITRDTTVVFYGDNFNWWAAYALWVFTLFGHPDVRLMNGGRMKWIEEKRPLSTDVPKRKKVEYPPVKRVDEPIRAFRDDVMKHVGGGGRLVDVRSPQEFSGELLHMPNYPQEGSLRGGHIPGASSVPWKRAANDDGTFKSTDELKAIYEGEIGLKKSDDVVAYCRIGERSSHTWFVLHHLLGFPKVRNYDGSWTEWGNLVRAPIEK
jgi:thiosulfate/3-mercaptopyruvate sulfurtransferase